MPKILVLAESGFGKTTSYAGREDLQIAGLDPKDTYVLTATSKPLPGRGSMKRWPILPNFSLKTTAADLKDYRRIASNDPGLIAHAILLLSGVASIKNIVLDDTNYLMQDYYMKKALSTGWDAPKKIGYDMGKIFELLEKFPHDKTFIMYAHGEEYKKTDGRLGYRMKTTGNMVQEYVTPEGKFDVLLIGTSRFNEELKKPEKVFVTEDDGVFTSAKSHGIFPSLYIHNDMDVIVKQVNAYYNGE